MAEMTMPEIQAKENAAQWEALLQAVDEAVCGLDREGRFTFVNSRAAEMLEFDGDEMLGCEMHDVLLHHDEEGNLTLRENCKVDEAVRMGEPLQRRVEKIFRKGGSSFFAEISVQPVMVEGVAIGAIMTLRDLTERLHQQRALKRTEKLAAVGQLTASIAHEINNPLESTINLLYLLSVADSLDDVRAYAKLAQTELARVAEITLQTLRFNRQHSRPIEVNMTDLLQSVLALYTGRMASYSIGSEIQVFGNPRVCALEGELRQVINNLVRNAVEVMPEGGRLRMRVRSQVDPETDQDGVRVTIADTGEGIAPHIQTHLFEPFYTTKENVGTGLGLWVSKGIVEKHGGRIGVKTRRGERHGTVFSMWLPTIPSPSLAAQAN